MFKVLPLAKLSYTSAEPVESSHKHFEGSLPKQYSPIHNNEAEVPANVDIA